MKRSPVVATMLALSLLSVPATLVSAGGPVSSISKPGDCSTIRYNWSGFRKASSATFELRHNGIYLDRASTRPVAASGSYTMPASLVSQIVVGDGYTVMGFLSDSGGRTIQPSPAVWWGTC